MANKTRVKSGPEKKSNLWLIVGGIAVMIGLVWVTMKYTNPDTPAAESTSSVPDVAPGRPTLIATLDPVSYTGKARAAYQAARDIPEILAQLPCYCGCMDGLAHRNNLYCFADGHGNICDLCQNIALDAQEMHRKGLPISQIRDNIRKTYSSVGMMAPASDHPIQDEAGNGDNRIAVR